MTNQTDSDFTTSEWIKTQPEEYHLGPQYEAEIQPIIDQLLAKCRELGAPVFIRVFIDQDENGCNSSQSCYLGGAGRATPELLAMLMMSSFNPEYLEKLPALMSACFQRYSK